MAKTALRDVALVLILGFTLLLLASCDRKPEGMTWQDFAILTGDHSKCDSASHPDVCRAGFTQATGDGSACNKIRDEDWRNTCFGFATGAKTETIDIDEYDPIDFGVCRYDSDCPDICEGTVRWKQGCNPREGVCIKTFEYPCKDEKEMFGSHSFGKTCVECVCVRDEEAIEVKKKELENKKKEISDEVKDMLASKQEVQMVWIPYYFERCQSALSDVTSKLIVDTALMLKSPPTNLRDITTSHTESLANELLSKTTSSNTEMSVEEFIAWNCNYYNALYQDLNVYDKKIELKQEEYKAISQELEAFPILK